MNLRYHSIADRGISSASGGKKHPVCNGVNKFLNTTHSSGLPERAGDEEFDTSSATPYFDNPIIDSELESY